MQKVVKINFFSPCETCEPFSDKLSKKGTAFEVIVHKFLSLFQPSEQLVEVSQLDDVKFQLKKTLNKKMTKFEELLRAAQSTSKMFKKITYLFHSEGALKTLSKLVFFSFRFSLALQFLIFNTTRRGEFKKVILDFWRKRRLENVIF